MSYHFIVIKSQARWQWLIWMEMDSLRLSLRDIQLERSMCSHSTQTKFL